MKQKILFSALTLSLALAAGQASAIEATVAAGATGKGDGTLRLGLAQPWQKQWMASDRGQLSGYWNGAYTYWEGGSRSSGAHSLSFAPVLTYTFTGPRLKPFIEGSIGVAGFSKTRVSGQKLGVSFSFEDRIGAGITLPNQGKLGVQVFHYSNARIKKPNDGVESYSLFYHHPF